jgi:hypothetical protein
MADAGGAVQPLPPAAALPMGTLPLGGADAAGAAPIPLTAVPSACC